MQQLDIFADSEPTQRANTLVETLIRFDQQAAHLALQRLEAVDPNSEDLPRFQLLCDFVAGWPDGSEARNWPRSPADIAALEELLGEHIAPAALILGGQGRALLRKCWADLASAAEACGVGPENRTCFAAELHLRAGQFPEAVRTAQKVPGGALRLAVQRWLALGYAGCGEVKQARRAALRYAWLDPQGFGNFLAELRDAALDCDWRDFQADFNDFDDFDDFGDLDATWFPAWCAHERKADATLLENLPDIDGAKAYRLIAGLAIRERGGLSAAVFEDRAQLKRLNESFFAFYLQRRSDLHGRLK